MLIQTHLNNEGDVSCGINHYVTLPACLPPYRNAPNVHSAAKLPNADGWRGAALSLTIEGNWSSYRAKLLKYLRQIAVITPYAQVKTEIIIVTISCVGRSICALHVNTFKACRAIATCTKVMSPHHMHGCGAAGRQYMYADHRGQLEQLQGQTAQVPAQRLRSSRHMHRCSECCL
jgi:hypothetical protein